MKKFTFMLLAAFIAVTSWAQPTAVKSRQLLPEQFAVKTATTLKQAPQMKKEMAPRQAHKVQAPAQRTMKKAKAAPKKAFDPTALMNGEPVTFLVKSYAYTVENQGTDEEPDYQLVLTTLPRVTEFWTATLDAATMTVSITGIDGGETAVTGTVDAEAMTITVPYGQATGTSSYGTLGLASATGAENLVCTLTEEGITFGDYWYIAIIDGDYAGYGWSDYYQSEAVLPNGKMAWVDSDGKEAAADVAIDLYTEANVATVWNFADEGVAVDVTLKPEGKFVIEPQLVYEGGEKYGDFYTYCADGATPTITGTGTENTLTFSSTWTCYAPSTGYWFGEQQPATITFDGTFVYPELPEAPATPADPQVTFFNFWNGESASVTLTVPCLDVDGNDIKGSLLTYQLFTMDDAGAPVALGEPIAYNSEANGTGDTKTVVLGEEAKDLVVIGAKSIYTAGGETHESEIAWFGIPQLVVVPEGLEVKEYPVTADAYSGSWTTYTGTVLVGIDGTDIYVKGILPHCPEGWAKGTIEDGVATFPVQCVGTYNGSVYIYLAAYGDGAPAPVTFTYDANEEIYISEDYILANSYTDKFGFYYPYFDGMTIGEESVPELVELPEGAEVVEYPFIGTTYSSSTGSTEFESKVNVAVVGDDVYVQGLNEYVPEAWVKGSKDAETGDIVFTTGQNLGVYETESSSYQFFMVGFDGTEITDVVMTYNEDEDYYKLQTDLLVNGKKSSLSYYKWYEAGSTIGIQTTFTATFDFNAMDVPTSAGSGETAVTDGDILETTEFTSDEVTLAISPKAADAKTENRFWATKDGPQLRVYSGTLTFSVPEGNFITEIAFNHNGKWGANTVNEIAFPNDEEAKVATWTPADGEELSSTVVVAIAANTQINSINVTYSAGQLPSMVETVAPDDLEASEWKIKATEIVYYPEEVNEETGEVTTEEHFAPEAYAADAQVGFYTVEGVEGTEVYIQGICPELPEAWVKGTLAEDNTVTIPYSTFFGVYEYIDWEAFAMAEDKLFLTAAVINEDNTATLTDVVFAYDAEAGTLTSGQTIFINADRREVSNNYYHWFEGMTITKLNEFAATPADPEITEVKTVDTEYPRVDFNVPTVDVEGNDLLTSKLSYQFYVESKGEVIPLVLTTELYEELTEDMTEIPYNFTDDWDIYNYKLYLNQDAEVIKTWRIIGVQSIYYGAGERHESNIVWAENPSYDENATGIATIQKSEDSVIYNIAGQRVQKAQKGIFIVNGKKMIIK